MGESTRQPPRWIAVGPASRGTGPASQTLSVQLLDMPGAPGAGGGDSSLELEVSLDGLWHSRVNTGEDRLGELDLLAAPEAKEPGTQSGWLSRPGFPRLPQLAVMLALPDIVTIDANPTSRLKLTCKPSFELLDDLFEICPSPEPQPLVPPDQMPESAQHAFRRAESVFPTTRGEAPRFPEPDAFTTIDVPVVSYLGQPCAVIRLPLASFQQAGEVGRGRVTVLQAARLSLDLSGVPRTRTRGPRCSSSTWSLLTRAVHGAAAVWSPPGTRGQDDDASRDGEPANDDVGQPAPRDEGIQYLAICGTDAATGPLAPLLERRAEEFAVGRMTVDEIQVQHPDLPVDKAIRQVLRGLAQGDSPLERVLLVGGPATIPLSAYPGLMETSYYSKIYSDLYYSDLTDDSYPDLIVGRLPSDDPQVISRVVQAILDFQGQEPGAWHRRILLHAASNSDPSFNFEITKQEVGRIISERFEERTEIFDDACSKEQMREQVNAGAALINYFGHGDWNYWASKMGMSTGALDAFPGLQERPPIVTTLACRTAALWQGGNDPDSCIGGKLVNATMAVCYVGATDVCWGWCGDIVQPWDVAFYQVMASGGHSPAECFALGKAQVLTSEGTSDVNIDNNRLIIFLGDPGMPFLPLPGDAPGAADAPQSARKQKITFSRRGRVQGAASSERGQCAAFDRSTADGEGSARVRYRTGAAKIFDVRVDDDAYVAIQGVSHAGLRADRPGAPLLPQEGLFLDLPPGAVDVEVHDVELTLGPEEQGTLMPTPEPTLRLEGESAAIRPGSLYGDGAPDQWPPAEDQVRVVKTWPRADSTSVLVQAALARCHLATGCSALVSELSFIVRYRLPEEAPESLPAKAAPASDLTLLRRLNSDSFVDCAPPTRNSGTAAPGGPGSVAPSGGSSGDGSREAGRFICIARHELLEQLGEFREAMEDTYDGSVAFVPVEEITDQAGAERAEAIRQFLAEAAGAGADSAEQVLLIGGYEDIPPFMFNLFDENYDHYNPVPSDLPYSDLSGDNYPDLAISRIPASDIEAVRTALEAGRLFGEASGDWARRALLIASDDPADQTSMDQIERALNDKDFEPRRLGEADLADDVTRALNEGVVHVDYSGHGSGPAWCTTDYDVNDLPATENRAMPPGVISISCLNNSLDLPEPSLGYAMVAGGHAAWFISGTRPTYFGSGEYLNQRFSEFLLAGSTASEALAMAKAELLRNWSGSTAEHDAKTYTLWGQGDLKLPARCLEGGEHVLGEGGPEEEWDIGRVTSTRQESTRVLFPLLPDPRVKQVPNARLVRVSDRLAAGQVHSAETYDLRARAYWLRALTDIGLFSSARVDPLPHQILAVDAFMRCEEPRRLMIADDVGLGKTIEAGLIIKLLLRRREIERVLIVSPANLKEQWQQELRELDLVEDIQIISRDDLFERLPHSDRVVESIDTLKQESLREPLARHPWDLVVVDEAHYLSRDVNQTTQRYRLLKEVLLDRARHILFLTATPHSGKPDRFIALLDLLSSEELFRAQEIKQRLGQDPAGFQLSPAEQAAVRKHLLLRRKRDAIDMEGNPIFFKRITQQVPYRLSDEELAFREQLDRFFGKLASEQSKCREGGDEDPRIRRRQAVLGFVRVTYQKIADSSTRAVQIALENRLRRLDGQEPLSALEPGDCDAAIGASAAASGADLPGPPDQDGDAPLDEFYPGERDDLATLIKAAREVATESKLEHLAAAISSAIGQAERAAEGPPKFLIFVEYLATLEEVASRLRASFGQHYPGSNDPVVLLHGQMSQEAKLDAQESFRNDDGVGFMVATSAGSEGINLQCCRMLVNYDLPWNPLKVEQRIGRIHRFGAQQNAHIYNFRLDDEGLDDDARERLRRTSAYISNRVMERLLEKLQIVAAHTGDSGALDPVAAGTDEQALDAYLRESILGNTAEGEWDELMQEALSGKADPIEQAEERVGRMLSEARSALGSFHELLASQRAPAEEVRNRIGARPDVVLREFASRYLALHGSALKPAREDGVFRFDLPPSLRELPGHELTQQQCEALVFDAACARKHRSAAVFGAGQPAFDAMVADCTRAGFGGQMAYLRARVAADDVAPDAFEGIVCNFLVLVRRPDAVLHADLCTVALDPEFRHHEAASAHLRLARDVQNMDPADSTFSPSPAQVREAIRVAEQTAMQQAVRSLADQPEAEAAPEVSLVSCAIFQLTGGGGEDAVG